MVFRVTVTIEKKIKYFPEWARAWSAVAIAVAVVLSPSSDSLRLVNSFFPYIRLDWLPFSLFIPSPSFPLSWPCTTIVTTFQSLPQIQDSALPVPYAEQRLSPVQNVVLHPHPSSIRIPPYNSLLLTLRNRHRSVSTHGPSSPAWSRSGHPLFS